MTFFKNFKAQNNLQTILYLVAPEMFGICQQLGLWRRFKEGTPHLVPHFTMLPTKLVVNRHYTVATAF